MGATVDERVVEMRFDNQEFESGVKQTLTTLEKLKLALKFDKGYEDSLTEISKATKNVSFDGMTTALEEVKNKFSALEIVGITALMNITNHAIETGRNLVKSLSTDQIVAGFNKYAEKTQAVQTIVNATGKSMEEVSATLERLEWFTDETSYHFNDMVSNIGKFTANSIPLETAEKAMEGIATWAAISGANATKASSAMYNLAQAISVGSLKMLDWRSIQNINMNTTEFKQTAMETAEALGTLQRAADGTLKTVKGSVVNIQTFDSTLSEAWFTTDVILGTLEKYGDFAGRLYEASELTGKGATELLSDLEKFKAGTLDINEAAKDTGVSVSELSDLYKELSSDTYDLGLRSFRAAQEAKTFQEVIDYVKEAVGSGWSKTWETIFGDYAEAKALWSGVAELMYDVFVKSGEARNDMLKSWKQADGRKYLIDALANSINALYRAMQPIKDAWNAVFPSTADEKGKRLAGWTKALAEFTSHMAISTRTANDLKGIFTGVFTILKGLLTVLGKVAKIIPVTLTVIRVVLTILIRLGGVLASLVGNLTKVINPMNLLNKALKAAKIGATYLAAGILILVDKLKELYSWAKNQPLLAPVFETAAMAAGVLVSVLSQIPKIKLSDIPKIFSNIGSEFRNFVEQVKNSKAVQTVLTSITVIFNKMKPLLDTIGKAAKTVGLGFIDLGKSLKNAFKTGDFSSFFKDIMAKLTALKDMIVDFAKNNSIFQAIFGEGGFSAEKLKENFAEFLLQLREFSKTVTPAKLAAIALSVAFLGLAGSLAKAANSFSDTMLGIKGFFGTFTKAIKNLGAKSMWIQNFGTAIATVAASLALLTLVDQGKLMSSAKTLGLFVAAMSGLAAGFMLISGVINKFLGFGDVSGALKGMAATFIALSAATIILVGALKILENTNTDGIYKKVTAIGIIMAELAAVSAVFGRFAPSFKLGTITLLFMATSVKKMVEALAILQGLNMSLADKNLIILGGLMAALGVFAKGLGSIGIFSAVGILMLLGTVKSIIPLLEEIGKADFGNLFGRIELMLTGFGSIITQLVNAMVLATGKGKILSEFVNNNPLLTGLTGMLIVTTAATAMLNAISKVVKRIGVSALIVVGSLYLLTYVFERFGQMDLSDKAFNKAIIFIGSFMGLLTLFVTLSGFATKIDKGGKILNLTAVILSLTLFFSVLTPLMKVIGSMSDSQWIKGVGAVTGIIAMLAILVKATEYSKEVKIGTIAALLVGISTLMGLVLVLSFVPLEQIIAATAGVTFILIALSSTIAACGTLTKKTPKDPKNQWANILSAAAMIASVAGALTLLTRVADLTKIKPALIGIGVALIEMVAVLWILNDFGGNAKDMLAAAGSILILSGSLIAIGYAISQLSEFHWDTQGAAIAAMSIMLGELVVAIAVLEAFAGGNIGTILSTAAAIAVDIVAMAGAMYIAAKAFEVFANTENLLPGIKAFSIILTEMTVALGVLAGLAAIANVFTGGLGGTGAFLAVGAAILALGGSMLLAAEALKIGVTALRMLVDTLNYFAQTITKEKAEGISDSLVSLADGLTAIGKAGGWLLLGGAGLIAVGFGLSSMGVGIQALLKAFAGGGADSAKEGLKTIVDTLVQLSLYGPLLAAASPGFVLMGAGLGAMGVGLSLMNNVAFLSIATGLVSLVPAVDKFTDSGLKLIAGSVGFSIAAKVLPKFGKGISKVGKALITLDLGLVGLSIAMKTGAGKAATNFIKGIYEGLKEGVSSLLKIVTGIGSVMIEGLCKVLKIHSPSLEGTWIGEMLDKGVELGIIENADDVVDSASKYLGEDVVQGIADKIGNFDTKSLFEGLIDGDVLGGAQGLLEDFGIDLGTTTDKVNDLKDAFEGLSGSGGGDGPLAGLGETIKGAISIFEEFDKKTDVSMKGMLNNLASQLQGMEKWKENLLKLLDRDISPELFDYLANMGQEEGYGYVRELANASDDEFQNFVKMFASYSNAPFEAADEIVKARAAKFGEDTANSLSDSFENTALSKSGELGDKVASAYIGSLNDKFVGYSSQLDDTSHDIGENAGGIYIGSLNDKLVSGFSKVPSDVREAAVESATDLGKDSAEGFWAGMDGEDATSISKQRADGFAKLVEEALRSASAFNSHSPARAMYPVGEDVAAGVGKGMESGTAVSNVRRSVTNLSAKILSNLTSSLKANKFQSIGRQITSGLASGVTSGMNSVLRTVTTLANSIISRARSVLRINSPSKVFEAIGSGVDEGFALGITENSKMVKRATDDMANESLIACASLLGRVKGYIEDDIDMNPTITPVLDLTSINQDAGYISKLFGNNPIYSSRLALDNGSMINAKLAANNTPIKEKLDMTNADVVNAIGGLRRDVSILGESMSKMQVVMDNGALVGEMVAPLDQALGVRAIRSRREK